MKTGITFDLNSIILSFLMLFLGPNLNIPFPDHPTPPTFPTFQVQIQSQKSAWGFCCAPPITPKNKVSSLL